MVENTPGSFPLLKIEDYHFTFPSYPGLKGRTLFKGLDLQLSRGEFLIILGKPESGKTTLGRCLCAVYPGLTQATVQGRILIDGEDISKRSACDWIDRVSLIFQDPDEQIVTSRTDDEAAFALESLGVEPHVITERMNQSFIDFGVSWNKERNPLSLSGGEKKRLLLSCMKMQDTDLWILDEPMDELDQQGQEFLLKTLSHMASCEQKGVLLFASKYHKSFASSSAEIAILHEGGLQQYQGDSESLQILFDQGLVPGESSSPESSGKKGQSIIHISGLKYQYPDNSEFSLEIDEFSLNAGETAVLAGPNGCGKSTLARLLCGLIPPQEGTILLEGEPAGKERLNRSCGYLFQNPDYQLFLPTVSDELELGLKHSGLTRKERLALVDEALELFQLPGRNAPPSLMSFGVRKRLQGAIYYLLEKRLYILDEADSGLSYRDYETIIRQLKKKDCALIIITHNQEISSIEGDHLYQMAGGRILEQRDLHREYTL
ncbi:MAG: hypothetical protein B6241_08785 [Spirochaetaceae bacterium 4572_59]|nr:MAG: hypothetical protein B6241_08785 [Spirochaetaceae bacterium 4572_59]